MNKNLHIAKNEAFKGEIYLICEMLLWGMFPVFSKLAFLSIPPLYTAGLSTLIAAGFFALVLTIRKEWKEIKIKSAWKDTLLASFIIGFVFYTLAFIGMEKTSAGNASIISLTEAFFAMFIFSLWKKEHMIFKHKIGAILMIVGAGIILFPGKIQINHGDIFILTAAAIAPFGNYFAQRARKKIGSIMIMFIRSIFAGICLLMLALIFEQKPSAQAIRHKNNFIQFTHGRSNPSHGLFFPWRNSNNLANIGTDTFIRRNNTSDRV
ncbi:DMT family transporter [Candidatus Peregrinibacteria bacterium]|nr:DMT family transporter [Candidatus Peregrinibacteria bacterium]